MSAVLTVVVWVLLAAVFLLALASLVFVIAAGASRTSQKILGRLRPNSKK